MNHIFTTLGIVWNERIADESREFINHYLFMKQNNIHITKKEQTKYDKLMELFFTYQCSVDSFATWEDYSRFVTTFAPDFLGAD